MISYYYITRTRKESINIKYFTQSKAKELIRYIFLSCCPILSVT
jgi:hypothetical protein